MSKDNSIIRKVIDKVEFFTVKATGESGMSQSGLARLCGVTRQSVDELIDNSVAGYTRSKWLKPLQGKEIHLRVGIEYKNANVLKASVCAAVIKHYAFSDNETAQYTLDKFLLDGINLWIHEITGWTPQSTNHTEQYFLSLILDEPKDWKLHFNPDWITQAERLTKWDWSWRCMSGFLNATVYSYFPEPMLNKLDEVNPVDEKGRRPSKQHQHFRDDADEKALKKHIDTVFTLMEVSASLDEFWRLMTAKFSGVIQLKIF